MSSRIFSIPLKAMEKLPGYYNWEVDFKIKFYLPVLQEIENYSKVCLFYQSLEKFGLCQCISKIGSSQYQLDPNFPLKLARPENLKFADFTLQTNLYQVITNKGAEKSFSNESLETFGDSFLKFQYVFYLVGKYCFLDPQNRKNSGNINPGILTSLKSFTVSNYILYLLAENSKLDLKQFLISDGYHHREGRCGHDDKIQRIYAIFSLIFTHKCGEFCRRVRTSPPYGYHLNHKTRELSVSHRLPYFCQKKTLDHEKSGLANGKNLKSRNISGDPCNHQTTNKKLADFVEAIIGFQILNFGYYNAKNFIKFLKINILEDYHIKKLIQQVEIQYQNSTKIIKIFQERNFHNLENNGLKYKFQYKKLLITALNHRPNLDLDLNDYQILEFLGDAVLDFILTFQIYHKLSDLDEKRGKHDWYFLNEGHITQIRMAMVNNEKFASISLNSRLRLDRYLRVEFGSF